MYLRSGHIINEVTRKIDRNNKKEEVKTFYENGFENVGIV